MRTESAMLTRNAQLRGGGVDGLGESGQCLAALHPDPEYSRSLCRRKESVFAKANLKRAAFNSPQTLGHRFDLIRRLFSNKFQRNVQRLRPHPFSIGCK